MGCSCHSQPRIALGILQHFQPFQEALQRALGHRSVQSHAKSPCLCFPLSPLLSGFSTLRGQGTKHDRKWVLWAPLNACAPNQSARSTIYYSCHGHQVNPNIPFGMVFSAHPSLILILSSFGNFGDQPKARRIGSCFQVRRHMLQPLP